MSYLDICVPFLALAGSIVRCVLSKDLDLHGRDGLALSIQSPCRALDHVFQHALNSLFFNGAGTCILFLCGVPLELDLLNLFLNQLVLKRGLFPHMTGMSGGFSLKRWIYVVWDPFDQAKSMSISCSHIEHLHLKLKWAIYRH